MRLLLISCLLFVASMAQTGTCTSSIDCDGSQFCWSRTCKDTLDQNVCNQYNGVATDDGWEWSSDDLFSDENFMCDDNDIIYMVSELGATQCPSGSEMLSYDECVEYGENNGSECGFEKIWTEDNRRPSGCGESLYSQRPGCTIYNFNENGGSWGDVRVVCKQDSTATTSTPSRTCTASDDCDGSHFCWSRTCKDTLDQNVCNQYNGVATDDGWEWSSDDLFSDENFMCDDNDNPLPGQEPTTFSIVMESCQLRCHDTYSGGASASGCHWGCSYYTGETCKDMDIPNAMGHCIACCRSSSYPSIEECELQCDSESEVGLYWDYERDACKVGCGYADTLPDDAEWIIYDHDCPDNDIGDGYPGATLEECQALCIEESLCRGFGRNEATQSCWLKTIATCESATEVVDACPENGHCFYSLVTVGTLTDATTNAPSPTLPTKFPTGSEVCSPLGKSDCNASSSCVWNDASVCQEWTSQVNCGYTRHFNCRKDTNCEWTGDDFAGVCEAPATVIGCPDLDDDGMIGPEILGYYRPSDMQGVDAPAGAIFQGDHTVFSPYPESCANWCIDNESCIGFFDSAGWCFTYEAPLSSEREQASGIVYLKCASDTDTPPPSPEPSVITNDCVNVNHVQDNPGYYTCDCVSPNDDCLSQSDCEEETNCPAMDGQPLARQVSEFVLVTSGTCAWNGHEVITSQSVCSDAKSEILGSSSWLGVANWCNFQCARVGGCNDTPDGCFQIGNQFYYSESNCGPCSVSSPCVCHRMEVSDTTEPATDTTELAVDTTEMTSDVTDATTNAPSPTLPTKFPTGSEASNLYPGYYYWHDGHCGPNGANGWVGPHPDTVIDSSNECYDLCRSRGDHVGYFAFNAKDYYPGNPAGIDLNCACYSAEAGCGDDDDLPAFNAYAIADAPPESDCPDSGVEMHSKCWYLSSTGANCDDTCASKGLSFEWYTSYENRVMAALLPANGINILALTQSLAHSALEVYNPNANIWHQADASRPGADNPGQYSIGHLQLACSCVTDAPTNAPSPTLPTKFPTGSEGCPDAFPYLTQIHPSRKLCYDTANRALGVDTSGTCTNWCCLDDSCTASECSVNPCDNYRETANVFPWFEDDTSGFSAGIEDDLIDGGWTLEDAPGFRRVGGDGPISLRMYSIAASSNIFITNLNGLFVGGVISDAVSQVTGGGVAWTSLGDMVEGSYSTNPSSRSYYTLENVPTIALGQNSFVSDAWPGISNGQEFVWDLEVAITTEIESTETLQCLDISQGYKSCDSGYRMISAIEADQCYDLICANIIQQDTQYSLTDGYVDGSCTIYTTGFEGSQLYKLCTPESTAVPTASPSPDDLDYRYLDEGIGTCQTSDGCDPPWMYFEDSGQQCEELCNQHIECTGYSNSNENNCFLWLNVDLMGGGREWGEAHCHVKTFTSPDLSNCPSVFSILESHHAVSHGDVCRSGNVFLGWRCPVGCEETDQGQSPWCYTEGTISPCRVGEVQLAETISIVVQVEGVTEDNKQCVCNAVANAFSGTCTNVMLATETVSMNIAVENAELAASIVEDENILSSDNMRMPVGTSALNIAVTATQDNDDSTVCETSTAMCGGGACVALKNDGRAVAWGSSSRGGDASSVDLTNIANAMCGGNACVALKNDGSAVAWGDSSYGGDASSVDLTNVANAMCGDYACVALKTDGSAVAWGSSSFGGDASSVDLTNVADAICGSGLCVAVKNDGRAVAWGHSSYGGDASSVDLTNIASAMCGGNACVALKNDGSAVAWGDSSQGGDASGVDLTNVASAMCGGFACIALKNDGSAVAWGSSSRGGDASSVDLTNIASAMCGGEACIALKNDGSAVAWGNHLHGGDASSVDLTNIVSAMCGYIVCIALKNDGSAVAWGNHLFGGDASSVDLTNVAVFACSAAVDCVIDLSSTQANCTETCGLVEAVAQIESSNGGRECDEYNCLPGDGACPLNHALDSFSCRGNGAYPNDVESTSLRIENTDHHTLELCAQHCLDTDWCNGFDFANNFCSQFAACSDLCNEPASIQAICQVCRIVESEHEGRTLTSSENDQHYRTWCSLAQPRSSVVESKCYERIGEDGMSCAGEALPESNIGSVSSLEACQALCDTHEACLHITYYPSNRRCYEYTNEVCSLTHSIEPDSISQSVIDCDPEYIRLPSELTCSESSAFTITDSATCESAAAEFGLTYNTNHGPTGINADNEPYGCFYRIPDQDILFNSKADSTTTYAIKPNRRAVCIRRMEVNMCLDYCDMDAETCIQLGYSNGQTNRWLQVPGNLCISVVAIDGSFGAGTTFKGYRQSSDITCEDYEILAEEFGATIGGCDFFESCGEIDNCAGCTNPTGEVMWPSSCVWDGDEGKCMNGSNECTTSPLIQCPDNTIATCCDSDGSCFDGDDDFCCGGNFYCSNNGEAYSNQRGGIRCPVYDDFIVLNDLLILDPPNMIPTVIYEYSDTKSFEKSPSSLIRIPGSTYAPFESFYFTATVTPSELVNIHMWILNYGGEHSQGFSFGLEQSDQFSCAVMGEYTMDEKNIEYGRSYVLEMNWDTLGDFYCSVDGRKFAWGSYSSPVESNEENGELWIGGEQFSGGRWYFLGEMSHIFASIPSGGGTWRIVGILNGYEIPSVGETGDLGSCEDNNCKLSDDAINALNFNLLKFEPQSPSSDTPVTFFDFTGRIFDSSAVVDSCGTPWTLDETRALAGNFDGVETCCDYEVCNFGRGHCPNNVISSYGFENGGGCGFNGPMIGIGDILPGIVTISVYVESDGVPSQSPSNSPSVTLSSCGYTVHADMNLNLLIGGDNSLIDAQRCVYRYFTLVDAQSACDQMITCVGVAKDAGLPVCGGLLYELREGSLSSWPGFTSYVKSSCSGTYLLIGEGICTSSAGPDGCNFARINLQINCDVATCVDFGYESVCRHHCDAAGHDCIGYQMRPWPDINGRPPVCTFYLEYNQPSTYLQTLGPSNVPEALHDIDTEINLEGDLSMCLSNEIDAVQYNDSWQCWSKVLQDNEDSTVCATSTVMCGGNACVALKNDGSAVAWGDSTGGGNGSSVDLTNVVSAMCGGYACIAFKNNGSAVAWGHSGYGGDASTVDLTNIANAMCGYFACVAVKNDGSAVAWGDSGVGGDASSVDLTNVASAMCGGRACVALKNDGSAVAWGNSAWGGDASTVDLTNIANAMCGDFACIALKNDGSAVAWGDSSSGGDASTVDLTNVANAMCGGDACIALKNDGSAVAWGNSVWGGDASTVDLTNIANAMCGTGACVAVKNDGSAVAWGNSDFGGNASTVDLTNIANAMCGYFACVAVKNDGSAVAWGDSYSGGDASSVDLTNVASAMCGGQACVALKNDGSAVAWGDSDDGGDASSVDLTNIAIFACSDEIGPFTTTRIPSSPPIPVGYYAQFYMNKPVSENQDTFNDTWASWKELNIDPIFQKLGTTRMSYETSLNLGGTLPNRRFLAEDTSEATCDESTASSIEHVFCSTMDIHIKYVDVVHQSTDQETGACTFSIDLKFENYTDIETMRNRGRNEFLLEIEDYYSSDFPLTDVTIEDSEILFVVEYEVDASAILGIEDATLENIIEDLEAEFDFAVVEAEVLDRTGMPTAAPSSAGCDSLTCISLTNVDFSITYFPLCEWQPDTDGCGVSGVPRCCRACGNGAYANVSCEPYSEISDSVRITNPLEVSGFVVRAEDCVWEIMRMYLDGECSRYFYFSLTNATWCACQDANYEFIPLDGNYTIYVLDEYAWAPSAFPSEFLSEAPTISYPSMQPTLYIDCESLDRHECLQSVYCGWNAMCSFCGAFHENEFECRRTGCNFKDNQCTGQCEKKEEYFLISSETSILQWPQYEYECESLCLTVNAGDHAVRMQIEAGMLPWNGREHAFAEEFMCSNPPCCRGSQWFNGTCYWFSAERNPNLGQNNQEQTISGATFYACLPLNTEQPTKMPTQPSTSPSFAPSFIPSTIPSWVPSVVPSLSAPTGSPITSRPSTSPSISMPSSSPSVNPSLSPTVSPQTDPTTSPTSSPTSEPSSSPTSSPSSFPTNEPTTTPSTSPTTAPTMSPHTEPTTPPSSSPSTPPTTSPSTSPTSAPSYSPTTSPFYKDLPNTCENIPWSDMYGQGCSDLSCETFGDFGLSGNEACCDCHKGGRLYLLSEENRFDVEEIATDIKLADDWTLSFWLEVVSGGPRKDIITFRLADHPEEQDPEIYFKNNRIHWRFVIIVNGDPLRIYNHTVEVHEMNEGYMYHSGFQLVHNASANEVIATVNGEHYHHQYHPQQRALKRSPRLRGYQSKLQGESAADLHWSMHAAPAAEALYFYEEQKADFPVLVITAWVVIAITLGVVLLVSCYGGISAWIAGADSPHYFNIFIFGLGVLDLLSDYQMTLQLYSIRDPMWTWAMIFCILPSLGSLLYFIRWYRRHSHTKAETTLKSWLTRYRQQFVAMMIVASANLGFFRLFWSRISPLYQSETFNMPATYNERRELMKGRSFNVFFEEMPFFVIQMIIMFRNTNGGAKIDHNTQLALMIALGSTVLGFVVYTVESILEAPSVAEEDLKVQNVKVMKPKADLRLLTNTLSKKFSGGKHQVFVTRVQKVTKEFNVKFFHTETNEITLANKIHEVLAPYGGKVSIVSNPYAINFVDHVDGIMNIVEATEGTFRYKWRKSGKALEFTIFVGNKDILRNQFALLLETSTQEKFQLDAYYDVDDLIRYKDRLMFQTARRCSSEIHNSDLELKARKRIDSTWDSILGESGIENNSSIITAQSRNVSELQPFEAGGGDVEMAHLTNPRRLPEDAEGNHGISFLIAKRVTDQPSSLISYEKEDSSDGKSNDGATLHTKRRAEEISSFLSPEENESDISDPDVLPPVEMKRGPSRRKNATSDDEYPFEDENSEGADE